MDIKQNTNPAQNVSLQSGDNRSSPVAPPDILSQLTFRTMQGDQQSLAQNQVKATPLPELPKLKPAIAQTTVPKPSAPPMPAIDLMKPITLASNKPTAEPAPPPKLPIVQPIAIPEKQIIPPPPIQPPPIQPPRPTPKPPEISLPEKANEAFKTPWPPMPPKPPVPPLTPTAKIPQSIQTSSLTGRVKFALAGGVLLAIILAGGTWIYYVQTPPASPSPLPTITKSSSPSPSLTQTPTVNEPAALFAMDSKKEISIKDALSLETLKNLNNEPAGNFIQLAAKTQDQKNMSSLDLLEALGLSLDPVIKDRLQPGQYNLFIYSQTTPNSSPFTGGITEGRAGLIIVFKEIASTTKIELKQTEPNLVKIAKAFFLGRKIEVSQNSAFFDNTYRAIGIRYINLPTPELSLDWAILDNKIILTTSKESMYAVIDKLLGR